MSEEIRGRIVAMKYTHTQSEHRGERVEVLAGSYAAVKKILASLCLLEGQITEY